MRDLLAKWTVALLFCGFSLAVAPLQVLSDEKNLVTEPDAGRGKQIAERLCVSCHVVSQDSVGVVPEGVPPFTVIANRRAQTARHIRGVLIEPHPPMPNMHLTRMEIEDIVAYLDELRDVSSGPPLLPKTGGDDSGVIYPNAS